MLAVYTARNSSMALFQRLKSERIKCQITSTPREISVGCGLCVRFDSTDLYRVKAHVNALKSFSFGGIWKESGVGYVRIY